LIDVVGESDDLNKMWNEQQAKALKMVREMDKEGVTEDEPGNATARNDLEVTALNGFSNLSKEELDEYQTETDFPRKVGPVSGIVRIKK
jgi:hypothetical protein